MTYSLTYKSQATFAFSDAALTELVVASRAHNANCDVTGALAYSNGWFLQVLEGETQTVKKLYDTIARDPRHGNPTIIVEGDIDQRAFADWSMALIRCNQTANDTLRNLNEINHLARVAGAGITNTAIPSLRDASNTTLDSIAVFHKFFAPPRMAI